MKFSLAARMLALWAAIMVSHYAAGYASEEKMEYPVSPVPFTTVRIEDGFWSPRMETNRRSGLLRAGGFQRRDLRKAGG